MCSRKGVIGFGFGSGGGGGLVGLFFFGVRKETNVDEAEGFGFRLGG